MKKQVLNASNSYCHFHILVSENIKIMK